MCAVTMGGSFFVSRRQFKILLIDNHTSVPFITSDQPIINMLANPTGFAVPERVEFYYPLSPTRAMLYLEKDHPRSYREHVDFDRRGPYALQFWRQAQLWLANASV
jgi:Protein of unknown function (DUF4238)